MRGHPLLRQRIPADGAEGQKPAQHRCGGVPCNPGAGVSAGSAGRRYRGAP